MNAPKLWRAEAGVVLEVRYKGQGTSKNWGEFEKLFANCTEVMGRTLRAKIFEGYNPVGLNQNFVAYYRAAFGVDKAGQYRFATNSTGSSFILVDGKLLAEYGGFHGADGRFAEHSGGVELTAGVHRLEYYYVQGNNEMVASVAWQRPGDRWPTLMEDRAFISVARGRTEALERQDGHSALDFFWNPRDHLAVNGRNILRYNFESASKTSSSLKWDFGDGTTAVGKAATPESHGYLASGTYTVTLSADGVPAVKQSVLVEPAWAQREEWDDNRWQEYRRGIFVRLQSNTTRPAETATLLAYAIALGDRELLRESEAAAWKQAKQFEPGDHAQVFYSLAHEVQRELKDYAAADRAFQEVIAGPADKNLKEQARLHRAGLLIHILGRYQEGLDLLQPVDPSLLVQPNEPILRQIFMADACASLGKRDDAVKLYEALHPVVNLADRPYAVNRRGRLLAINSFIKRGDNESALQELNNIEWETPIERINDETSMLRAECYLAQNDFELAAIVLNRVIKCDPTSGRMPELLFALIKAYKGMKKDDLVDEVFAKLKKEQPYAAETALAAKMLER